MPKGVGVQIPPRAPTLALYAPTGYYAGPADDSDSYADDSEAYQNGPAYPDPSSYYQLGHDWAQDLRRNAVSWDQFVSYLNAYIVTATDSYREEFRHGFLDGYGINAAAAFDRALQQAGG